MAYSASPNKVIELILWPSEKIRGQKYTSAEFTERVYCIFEEKYQSFVEHLKAKIGKDGRRFITIDTVFVEALQDFSFMIRIMCHNIKSGHDIFTPDNTKYIGQLISSWKFLQYKSLKTACTIDVHFPSQMVSEIVSLPFGASDLKEDKNPTNKYNEECGSDYVDSDDFVLKTVVIAYVKDDTQMVLAASSTQQIQMQNVPNTKLWLTTLKWNTEKRTALTIHIEKQGWFGKNLYSKDIVLDPTVPYLFLCCSGEYHEAAENIIKYIIGNVAIDDLKESILQLEHFCCAKSLSKFSVLLKDLKDFHSISKKIQINKRNVIVYCYLASKVSALKYLDKSIAELAMSALKSVKSDSLPSTSVETFGEVTYRVCKILFEDDCSFLMIMYFFLEVLGVKTLKSLIIKCPFYRPSSQFDALEFLDRLHYLSRENPDLSEMLIRGFRSLSLIEHMKIHKECVLAFSWTDDLLKKATEELLIEKIIKSMIQDKIEKRAGNLLKIWNECTAIGIVDTRITYDFEQALTQALEKANSRNESVDDISSVITNDVVFIKQDSLQRLMKALTDNNDINIRGLVINMLDLDKMECMNTDFVYSTLDLWLKKLIESETFKHKPDQGIYTVYLYFTRIVYSNYAKSNPGRNENLVEIMLKMLERTPFETMMSAIQWIDKCSEEQVAGVYSSHLKSMITKKKKVKSLDDLMKVLGSGLGVVSSRVKRSILVDAFHNFDLKDTDHFECVFTKILENSLFWSHSFRICEEQPRDEIGFIRHPKLLLAKEYVSKTAKAISERKVSCSFLSLLQAKREQLDDIEDALFKEKKISANLTFCSSILEQCLENIKKIDEVFNRLKSAWVMTTSGYDIKEFTSMRRQELLKGDVRVDELHAPYSAFSLIDKLAIQCKSIERAAMSRVFINIVTDHISEVENQDEKGDVVDDIYLEGNDKVKYENIQKLREAINLIEIVGSKCLQLYKSTWKSYLDNNDQEILYISKILHGVDNIEKELNLAQEICQVCMSDVCKKSIFRFHNIKQYAETVETIKAADFAFNFSKDSESAFLVAGRKFDNILNGDLKGVTLNDLIPLLDDIDKIHHLIDKDAQNILQSVGQASSLLDFLREVIDEDIRNLIDAVEEHSEQYVSESTVSDLIEIKRFFDPVLRQHFKDNIPGLFVALQKQVSKSGIQKVPEKIYVCCDNLHSLKALYRNVANRGERTVEVIENIINEGVFSFHQHEKLCEVFVEYNLNAKSHKYSNTDLSDLRSRALLLMNAEKYKEHESSRKDQLIQFVQIVETAFEAVSLYTNLQEAGHFEFANFEHSCKNDELSSFKDQLLIKFNDWKFEIDECRKEFYYMNFLYADQLFELYRYLTSQDLNNKSNVTAVLRFINPTLQNIQPISTIFNTKPHSPSQRETLKNIGETLQDFFLKLDDPKPIHFKVEGNVNIVDKVQPGRPFITSLEEESTLVVRTILALYLKTTSKFPEANQILFCRADTTYDEINLLLQRCLLKQGKQDDTLYCVANIEKLDSEVQFQLHDAIRKLPQGKYLICFLCRGQSNHPFLDRFSDILLRPSPLQDDQIQKCFDTHWSNVKVITSDVPGLGKSEYIQSRAIHQKTRVACLHISGPINRRHIIEDLISMNLKPYHSLHVDIGSVSDPFELDLFLFELLVLGYVSAGSTAYALQSRDTYIEIANTVNDTLRNALPVVTCFKRKHIRWENYNDLKVSQEVCSPIQVVCHYLKSMDKGILESEDKYFTGQKKARPLPFSECRDLLKSHFSASSDVSYTVVNVFLKSLSDQLKKLSASTYFRAETLKAMLGEKYLEAGIKTNLVKALTDTSKDFSARSVHSCRSSQASTLTGEDSAATLASRVSGMIRWEDSNHLVILFHQETGTVSPLYRNVSEVPPTVVDLIKSQTKTSLTDYKKKTTMELENILVKLVRSSVSTIPCDLLSNLRKEYALTPDNLLKMILISLRVNTKLPVLIMGETGCGKTSLIRYLAAISGVQFEIFTVHAGIDETKLKDKIKESCETALKSLKSQYWLFLDEINTCDNIGLISSVLCHRFCQGISIPPNLILLAACNPYRLRKSDAIMTAGLQGLKIKTDELSRLVYRVHPLSETLLDYVWDFGFLSEEDEKSYIMKMVSAVFEEIWFVKLLTDLLVASQHFVRRTEDTEYSVSLRDVDRCLRLTKWFRIYLENKNEHKRDLKTRNITAIILGLAVCYHSRFSQYDIRQMYLQVLSKTFANTKEMYSAKKIADVILEEQRFILEKMVVPDGIALNVALQENVFMLIVCILNKVPIFLVGKPGCSKSLSMQLIRSNLRGKDSTDKLFQNMPQLFCVSFQGSESSTSDGILKVFEKAEKYQKLNDDKDVLSVVILDEIGLAEISRFNPLKILHGLLEPGRAKDLNIAVVGISNWALDAAKMNRAIHLSRPDMDVKELEYTGKSIRSSIEGKKQGVDRLVFQSSPQQKIKEWDDKVDSLLEGIARGYDNYASTQGKKFQHFHGLRDFYSLVKYTGRKLEEIGPCSVDELSKIVITGILRNFGGLPAEKNRIIDFFRQSIPYLKSHDVPALNLIKENIADKACRHLMLITNGDSVISILESELINMQKPFEIIFGSSFEDDLSDEYNYRILSRIILCMEQGMVLILKDLESIYGSLYDMLNQNYTIVGKKRNCRVALGQYSNPMCQVHDDFKCIVLVEESNLDFSDPPFLNRFEKQQFEFSDFIQNDSERTVVTKLTNVVNDLCKLEKHSFDPEQVIPAYSDDLLVSLVNYTAKHYDPDALMEMSFENLLWIMPPEVVIRARESALYEQEIHFADIDVIEKYLLLPIHSGLENILCVHMSNDISEIYQNQLFCIFTNASIHSVIPNKIGEKRLQKEKLAFFKSEKQLASRVADFFSSEDDILIVQSMLVHDGRHMLLAKVTLEKHLRIYNQKSKEASCKKVVCLLVHLERNVKNQVPLTFLSGWKLIFLDSITKHEHELPFYYNHDLQEVVKEHDIVGSIHESLFWALSRIKFGSSENSMKQLENILGQLQGCTYALYAIKDMIIGYNLETTSYLDSANWVMNVAMDTQALMQSGSFLNSLQNYINELTKVPLSMFLYKLLDLNLMTQVFVDDDCTKERQSVWKSLIQSKEFVSIENIAFPTGPECYICHSSCLSLKLPGVHMIMENIENQRSEFLDIIRQIRLKTGIRQDEDLPLDIFYDACQKCSDIVCRDATEVIMTTNYPGCNNDFLDDFCNIQSFQIIKQMTEERRKLVYKWALMKYFDRSNLNKEDFKVFVTSLSACVWLYGQTISAACRLAEIAELSNAMEWGWSLEQCDIRLNHEQSLESSYSSNQTVNEFDYVFPFSNEENLPFEHSHRPSVQCQADESGNGEMSEEYQSSVSPADDDDEPLLSNESKYSTFVRSVCMSLLPTQSLFTKLSDQAWLELIKQMIPFASIISNESGELMSIKLCHDIADVFRSVGCENLENICKIGFLLQENNCQIDSIELCEFLFSVLSDVQNNAGIDKQRLQKLFCLYIFRCLVFNPEAVAHLNFILSKVANKEMFVPQLTHLGQVLRTAILLDIIDEDYEKFNPYMDILTNEISTENMTFALCFDQCLKTMNSDDDLRFLILLTDMIEENAIVLDLDRMKTIDSASDEMLLVMSNCREKIEKWQMSLDRVCAVAMTRRFIKMYIQIAEDKDTTNIPILSNHINAFITSGANKTEDTVINRNFLHYLLKIIENEKGQEQIEKTCAKLQPSLPALKSVTWKQDVVLMCHTFNPLCMYVDQADYQFCLEQVNTFGSKENKLHEVLNKPDKLLDLFSVLAQKFYMKMSLAERNDSERELAKSLGATICKSLTENQRKLLMPILEGKFDNTFALSTVVDAPAYHMISIIIHMAGLMFFKLQENTPSIWKRYMFTKDMCQTDFIPTLSYESYLNRKTWPECLQNYSPVVVCVLQILVLSCNLLSMGFSLGKNNDTEQTKSETLAEQLSFYWKHMKESIHLNFNDICLLMHIILNRSQELFLHDLKPGEHLANSFRKQAEVSDNVIRNRVELFHLEMKRIHCIEKRSCESCVLEAENCGEFRCLLFRIPASVNVDMLKVELYSRENKQSFSLLEFILQNIDRLKLPNYILSFINWHLAVVTHGSYKHRKVDFKEITVQKFLADENEERKRKALTKAFEMFSGDWNEIRKLRCNDFSECQMDAMNIGVTMTKCTILNDNSVMKTVLDILVNIQNSTLTEAQSSMNFIDVLSDKKQVSILDVKKGDLITFEWNDDWLHFSQPDTGYGMEKSIQFDFEKIEKEILAETLVGKAKILTPKYPTIMFTDDLHRNSVALLVEVESLVPQKRVSNDVRNTIETRAATDSTLLSNLLTHVGMTLSLLRKTENSPQKPKNTGTGNEELQITQYLDKWETITGMESAKYRTLFPEGAQLCHIVDLYQLLEEMNGDIICETLDDQYRDYLPKDGKDALEKLKERQIKFLQKLEHPLKVFVHRSFGFRTNTVSPEQPLIDYILNVDFWWHDDFDGKRIVVDKELIGLNELLLPEVLVKHIYEVVKFIKKAIEDDGKKKITINEITSKYQTTRTQPKSAVRRRKLKSTMRT